MKRPWIAGCLILGGLLIGACTHPPAEAPDQPLQRPNTAAAEGGQTRRSQAATVRTLRLAVQKSDPVKIAVTLSGVLPDGCTRIQETETIREGNAFHILLYTERPADAMCTMALVPFEQTVTIDTAGLPPGGYTVRAGDHTAAFRLASR